MICPFPVPVNQLFRSPFTPSLAFQLQSHQPNYSRLDKRGRWSFCSTCHSPSDGKCNCRSIAIGRNTMTEQQPRAALKGNFPSQLHHVLGEIAADGLEHIASWQPHGRSFKVHDQKAFVKNILGWYDRMTYDHTFAGLLTILTRVDIVAHASYALYSTTKAGSVNLSSLPSSVN
jgi:hypothetical protein